jgi:hypothetical protein
MRYWRRTESRGEQVAARAQNLIDASKVLRSASLTEEQRALLYRALDHESEVVREMLRNSTRRTD